jgi:hypothetical protein
MEGAMEIVFWVIIAIIVLAIFYVCAVSLRKRKRHLNANLQSLTSRLIQKGTESICRREEKLMTTLPERFERLDFVAGR